MTTMHPIDSKARLSGLRALILPATLAAMVAALAVPSRAASISFNPGNGVQTGITGFNYASSSVLATLGSPSVGATYNVYYESVVSGTQGNVLPLGANFNLNNSGNEFTVIAGFRETITSISPSFGGGVPGAPDTALINFTLASPSSLTNGTATPNFFYMFANSPGSANPTTGNGAGFGISTAAGSLGLPILSGHLTTTFNGSFTEDGTFNGTTFTPGTTAFNTQGPGTSAITTPLSVLGAGGTKLTVQVDSTNSNFFTSPLAALTFSTTNTLPFDQSTAPLSGFYSAPNATPNITYPGSLPNSFDTGTINGQTGNSLMFNTVASNGFSVPEPSSIIPALTAAMGIPMFLCFRRQRSKKTSA